MSRSYIVAALASIAICTAWPLLAAAADKGEKKEAGKAEHHVGPHKGHLIELGEEEYHAEILHDDKTGKVTIYVLDSEAKKSVATAAKDVIISVKVGGKPKQFKLKAMPQKDDEAEMTTRFGAVDKDLIEALDAEGGNPHLKIVIGEKSFSGKIPHEHDHDHDHDEVPKPKKPAPKK